MSYAKQTWNNNDSATPLSAERLNHLEDGVADALTVEAANASFVPQASLAAFVAQEAMFAAADGAGDTSGPDWTKLALFGSSLANGLLSRIVTLAAGYSATVIDGSGSGQSAEHILARLGSRRLKVGGFVTIPATGTVVVPSSNVSSLTFSAVGYHGYFAGHPERPGTLSKGSGSAAGFTFTPDATGTAITINVGTEFIPDFNSTRTVPLLANIGKNNMTGVTGGTGDVEKVIQWTIDAANYMQSLGHPVLILGHYADRDEPVESTARTRILNYNTAMQARFGDRYLDLYTVFSPGGNLLLEYADPDGIHLNTAGNNLLRDLIAARLAALGWFPEGLNLTDSLVASFRGDSIAGADAATVASWVSSAGSAGALTLTPTTNGPELNVGGFNGHKTVLFDPTNSEGMSTPANSLALTESTYVLICRLLTSTGAAQTILSGDASSYQRIFTSSDGEVINASGTSATQMTMGTHYGAPGMWLIIAVRFDAADSTLSTNGTTAVGTLTNSLQSRLRLAVNPGGTSSRANAEYAGLDIYSKALTDDEIQAAIDKMVDSLAAA